MSSGNRLHFRTRLFFRADVGHTVSRVCRPEIDCISGRGWCRTRLGGRRAPSGHPDDLPKVAKCVDEENERDGSRGVHLSEYRWSTFVFSHTVSLSLAELGRRRGFRDPPRSEGPAAPEGTPRVCRWVGRIRNFGLLKFSGNSPGEGDQTGEKLRACSEQHLEVSPRRISNRSPHRKQS